MSLQPIGLSKLQVISITSSNLPKNNPKSFCNKKFVRKVALTSIFAANYTNTVAVNVKRQIGSTIIKNASVVGAYAK